VLRRPIETPALIALESDTARIRLEAFVELMLFDSDNGPVEVGS
jgi:hypothetical protein